MYVVIFLSHTAGKGAWLEPTLPDPFFPVHSFTQFLSDVFHNTNDSKCINLKKLESVLFSKEE